MATVSQGWRQKGNQSYQRYQQATNFQDKKKYLQEAIHSYYRAFEIADNNDDKSSAAKNQGTAEYKLAKLLEELGEKSTQLIEFHCQEAMKYFSWAHSFGATCKTLEWIDSIQQLYTQCAEEILQKIKTLTLLDRSRALGKFLDQMGIENLIKSECFLELASINFHIGITAVEEKDFKQALQALNDCIYPVKECIRLARGDHKLTTEANVINEDLNLNRARAEALQAIALGDKLLKKSIEEEETLNMTDVYNALDYFKQASLLTREVELEIEAIAASRIGLVFDKVIKLKHKARHYLNHCIQLTSSMWPRNFYSEEWYVTCTTTLQRYQQEAVLKDEAEEQKKQDELRKTIQKELNELSLANIGSGPDAFLRFIYHKYPVANPEDKLDENKLVGADRKTVKQILLKAVRAYHPDKHSEDEAKMKLLCNEITKILNDHLTKFKCVEEPPQEQQRQSAEQEQHAEPEQQEEQEQQEKSDPKKEPEEYDTQEEPEEYDTQDETEEYDTQEEPEEYDTQDETEEYDTQDETTEENGTHEFDEYE